MRSLFGHPCFSRCHSERSEEPRIVVKILRARFLAALGMTGKVLLLPDDSIRHLNIREALRDVGVVDGVAAPDPGGMRVEFNAAWF